MFLGRTSNDVRPFTFLPQKRKNRRKNLSMRQILLPFPRFVANFGTCRNKRSKKTPGMFFTPRKTPTFASVT